jgi:DNA-binding SARP family transcriptional activator
MNDRETLRLELIGGFRLLRDGSPVALMADAQRLMAYLALNGPAARLVTAGTLWPEVTEARALGSLRTAVWRCNRAVGGLVTSHRHGIELSDRVRSDVADLLDSGHDSPFTRSDPPCGDLLPGWYDDWVLFERERLRHRRLHALERAAAELTAAGHFAASLERALSAVRTDPLRESARRAVIAVHLAQNNLAEAMREYRRFRALLLDQLGIEPSEDLAALVFRSGSRGRVVTRR